MRRLSGFDTAALALETDASPLHMMAILVLDTSTVPGGYSYERLRNFLAARIHVVPPLLQQLVRVPGELHRPVWVDAGPLDWDYHLPRTILAEPLDDARLSYIAGELASRRLDRDRPLWQLHVVEDPTSSRVALMARVHHALMDGLGGMEFMSSLFELEPNEPDDPPAAPRAGTTGTAPSAFELLRGAVADLPSLVSSGARLAGNALRIVNGFARPGPQVDESDAAPRPFSAPATPFNARLTATRSVALSQLPFATVRDIRTKADATVNDVVLAIVSGALRTYLLDRDALPERALVAGVPAASDAPAASFGNALSFLLVRLATEVDDPLERLQFVQHEAGAAKRTADDIGMMTLARLLDAFTPLPIDATLALYRSVLLGRIPPLWNVIVSNVPGPPVPLFVAGARLVGLYPLGPVYEGLGMNITVLSREDTLDVGIVACADLVPDVDALAALMRPALDELAVATGVPLDLST
jgi:diacylglycerol O-acyltransferase